MKPLKCRLPKVYARLAYDGTLFLLEVFPHGFSCWAHLVVLGVRRETNTY